MALSTKLLKEQHKAAFKFSEKEKRLILNCSVERVINTTLQILDSIEARNRLISTAKSRKYNIERTEQLDELIDINSQDWDDLKEITTKIWNAARNKLFIEQLEERTGPVIAASTRASPLERTEAANINAIKAEAKS